MVGSTMSSGGIESLRLHPGYVLSGAHVGSAESFTVGKMTLRLQHLYGWLGASGFSREDAVGFPKAATIAYQLPDDAVFSVGEGASVSFGLRMSMNLTFQCKSMTEDAEVTFQGGNRLGFRECRDMASVLRLLLHFAVLKRVYAVSMTLSDVQEKDGRFDGVDLWASDHREPLTEMPVDQQWVFRFSDVKADFGRFFTNWLQYRKKHSESLDCYLTTVYHPLPSSVRHLCLAQALEAYHGERYDSHGERGYKAKVEQLCSQAGNSLKGLVDDAAEFSEQVKDTRNYYTHHNPKDLATRKVVTVAPDLIRLNEKMAILLQSCMLSDIGIPAERLCRLRRQMATEIVQY
jgi:hypothetical protein